MKKEKSLPGLEAGQAFCQRGLSVAVTVVALVLRVADHVAAEGAKSSTDGRAFKTATALTTDNAADGCAAEGAIDGSLLGCRTCGAGGQGKGGNSEEGEDDGFHRFNGDYAPLVEH